MFGQVFIRPLLQAFFTSADFLPVAVDLFPQVFSLDVGCPLQFTNLRDICSFCSPRLSTMLVKASSIDALLITNGVTSGGVTILVPGSFVPVETRVLPLCLDVSS